MASWADPSDYWFNRVPPNQSPLPAMQLGAQIVRQRAVEVMREKELELETQRTMISVQDAISKRELQTQIMAGDAELAKAMAGIKDWSDPSTLQTIFAIGEKSPLLVRTPQFREAIELHKDSLKMKENRRLIEEAGYVPPDEATGAPGYYRDARGGIRFAPAPRVSEQSPTWIGENKETGMPGHFVVGGGRVQFPPRKLADGSTFQPESKMVGTTELIHVSPNKWQVVQKEPPSGSITDLEREKLRDLRSKIASKLGAYAPQEEIDALQKQADALYGQVERRSNRQVTIPDSVNFIESKTISKEEYDKLPAGSEYIAPDGSKRIKK